MGKKADREIDAALRSRAYERIDEQGNRVFGLNLGLQGRTVDRLRRCENCRHFDREERAAAVYRSAQQRTAGEMRANGSSEDAIDAELRKVDQFMAQHIGEFGCCTAMLSPIETDLVHKHHLCGQWSMSGPGAFGREHGPLDPLDDELYDRLGDSPTQKTDAKDERAVAERPECVPEDEDG